MKILFVIRDMFMGGAGKQLALTASGLIDRGHEVYLYTYIGQSLEHDIDERVKYVPEAKMARSKVDEYLLAPYHIHKALKTIKPDVAISWRANAGCMLVLGAIGTGVKTIFSERSDPYMETNAMLKIATRICDYSDGGVFQTSQARDFYKRLAPKSEVVHNPINTSVKFSEIVPLADRKKEIAWVGRFMNVQKRIDVALRAMQIMHKSHPEYVLSFFGDGPDMPMAQKLSEELGISDSVIFHGVQKGIVDIIRNSRLLMLSSDYEGIPNVVIESFVAGTPVVSTDCSPGGARVLIDNRRNGIIVPIRDHERLAHACIEVIDNDALSNEFINASRKKLDEFDPNKIFDKWNEYITRFK